MVFLEEVLSVLTTPFILWFSLPNSSEKIVDFFREFTVHVDGIGYVCSFAVFDFKRHGKVWSFVSYSNRIRMYLAELDRSIGMSKQIERWSNR